MSNSKKFVVKDYITYTATGCKGLGFACEYENCQNQATSELLNDSTHAFILALCDTCLNSVLELIPTSQYREQACFDCCAGATPCGATGE